MGWWGFNVMEGDEPLDIMYEVTERLGGECTVECDTDAEADREERKQTRRMVKALKAGRYHKLIDYFKNSEDFYCDRDIALQVLGETIMCHGGRMSERTKSIFRAAARRDEWASDPDEVGRKAAMENYIRRITKYKNKPIKPVSRGLFAALSDHIARGKTGLLNK